MVKSRKSRMSLKKMRRTDGSWIEGDKEIVREAVEFFQSQFSKSIQNRDIFQESLEGKKI